MILYLLLDTRIDIVHCLTQEGVAWQMFSTAFTGIAALVAHAARGAPTLDGAAAADFAG